jgi:RNA polymerase sigma-70 factor, ECF subfamily
MGGEWTVCSATSVRSAVIITFIVQRHNFDADYVQRLASRDEDAERHFTTYFGELLTAKLRSRLRSHHSIQDVKQETFLRVLRTIRQQGGVTDATALGAFVNSVCNNVLFELYRAESRLAEPMEDRPSDEVNAETAMVDGQQQAAVRAVLSGMPEKDRRILRWLFFEERDKDEVCRHLKVDREYLRVLLHRAKSRFRSDFMKRQQPPPAGFAAGLDGPGQGR